MATATADVVSGLRDAERELAELRRAEAEARDRLKQARATMVPSEVDELVKLEAEATKASRAVELQQQTVAEARQAVHEERRRAEEAMRVQAGEAHRQAMGRVVEVGSKLVEAMEAAAEQRVLVHRLGGGWPDPPPARILADLQEWIRLSIGRWS